MHQLAPEPGAFEGPRPLVVLLHPYGGRVERLLAAHGIAGEATRRGWVVIAPAGYRDQRGMPYWNATGACCDRDGRGNDDVAFLRAVIERAMSQHDIDPDRVWLVGSSNGGYMSYRMACDAADLVRGVISLAGMEPLDAESCQPSRPVSVVHIHGTDDDIVHYAGEANPPLEERGEGYPGAEETVQRWVERNGCAGEPEVGPSDAGDGEHSRWTECEAGTTVTLHRLDGAPHILLPSDAIRDVTVRAIEGAE